MASTTAPMDAGNPVTVARSRINETTERLLKMQDFTREIADGMFGETEFGPSIASDQPPRSGEAGRLHDDLDNLNAALGLLDKQLGRFNVLSIPTVTSAGYAGSDDRSGVVRRIG